MAEAKAPPPCINDKLIFRPLMLANPITKNALIDLKHQDFAAEWKWDGIRAILVGDGEDCRLYSRTGDDIGKAFPDIVGITKLRGVVDGELLVARKGVVAPFNDLQKRLGRKNPSRKLLEEYLLIFGCMTCCLIMTWTCDQSRLSKGVQN